MRSVVVVLPASTCAMMPILRILSSMDNGRVGPAGSSTVKTERPGDAPCVSSRRRLAASHLSYNQTVWVIIGSGGKLPHQTSQSWGRDSFHFWVETVKIL